MIKKSLMALALVGAAASAQAAPLVFQGNEFSTFVSGGDTNYNLTLTMDFTGGADSEFIGDRLEAWSLQLPGEASVNLISVNGSADVSGWSWNDTGKAVSGGCGNGNANTVCVDAGLLGSMNGTGMTITTSSVITWVVNVVFASSTEWDGSSGNFHLLTVEEDCQTKRGVTTCEWKKGADLISMPIQGDTPPPPEVPLPGTLGLLGLGLAGLGAVRRKKQAA